MNYSYIDVWALSWDKPDYHEIIGVFPSRKALDKFMVEHFTPDEILQSNSLKIKMVRYYQP